jgi:hypothetical protein
MSQEETPSVFVSKKVMCHLLIYKRNIENILKRAILNYFWLMLQYLFSCIRKEFLCREKNVFFITAKTYFSFLYIVCVRNPKRAIDCMVTSMWPVPAVPCMILCCRSLHSSQPHPVLLTHWGFQTPAPANQGLCLRSPLHSSCAGKRS